MTELEPKKRKKRELSSVAMAESAVLQDSSRIRDSRGLLKNATYEFDSNGFVNWRKMIAPEHIVLNRMAMARAGIDTKTLSKEETDKFLTDLGDDKKLVKLSGFRELSKIRGVKSVAQSVKRVDGVVICECTIIFIPNFETNYSELSYTAVASAARENVAPSYGEFLEAIASNRAFGRCVREALGIYVVTDEEMNFREVEDAKVADAPNKPLMLVKERCIEKGIAFATLLKYLEGKGLTNPNWISFETLGIEVALDALAGINKNCS